MTYTCLWQIDVLKCKNDSEWEAPTFMIPKNSGTTCFISDVRELNSEKTSSYLEFTYKIKRLQICINFGLNLNFLIN